MSSQQQALNLVEENSQFVGIGGVSEGNAQAYFVPAFKDVGSGQIEVSRFQGGLPAPCHLLDGLPGEWITERDSKGHVVSVKSTVISGFVRHRRFFSRQQAADFMAQFYSAELETLSSRNSSLIPGQTNINTYEGIG